VPGAARVDVTLYYQGTSREFVEFLRDEINGTGGTLTSPTPSGEAVAYIAQSDPFFSKVKAWGNTIWELWRHNHGLDDNGTEVPGVVPVAMTTASVTPLPVSIARININKGLPVHPKHDGSPTAVNGLNDIVPVTVLTTAVANGDSNDFDATQVNPTSVRFGAGAAEDTDGAALISDNDGDGDTDAGFAFLMGDTGITCEDTSASIQGETYAGHPFSGAAEIDADCDATCHN
jgi:hypothetical protein